MSVLGGGQESRLGLRSAAVLLVAVGLVWTAWLGYAAQTPPADNLEQLIWVRSLEWGYYKHPPLPTWLLWPLVELFGLSAWVTYVLGAAVTLLACATQWQMLRQVRGENYAFIVLSSVLCVTYYNGRLYYYNHNTVLTLLSALAFTLTWRALTSDRPGRWWAAVGLVIGLGFLAKYQMAVTSLAIGVSLLYSGRWRSFQHLQGVGLAAAIAAVLVAHHVGWLVSHDYPPIRYAVSTSLGRALDAPSRFSEVAWWAADQVINRCGPAMVMLVLIAFNGRKREPNLAADSAVTGDLRISRGYIVIWGLLPLVSTCAVGLVFGSGLQPQWGTAFMLFLVPAVWELAGGAKLAISRPRQLIALFLTVQCVLLAINVATSPLSPKQVRRQHWPAFDSRQLASAIAPLARAELGGPICVISGPAEISAALAMALPERPYVLVNGNLAISPWVSPSLIRDCGVLVLREGSERRAKHPLVDFSDISWEVARCGSLIPSQDKQSAFCSR